MEKSQRVAFDINKVEIGTKIITRDGYSGKIDSIDLTKLDYPISATIELDGKEVPLIFTKEGHFYSNNKDSMFDLFLEEVDIKCTENKKLAPNQDGNIPNGAIVYEDLNGDEGFYKVHLDYLNKEQVEIIEYLVKDWNKQEKQKPVDNDAPKFKVGDWVVTKDGKVNQVKTVCNYGYACILDDERYLSSSQKDMYHFWTIQDAKPGDILVNYSIIFIGRLTKDGYVAEYCHVNINNGKFYDTSNKCFIRCSVNDVITPATKEQCDLLVQKMKEAGYMWDTDKKALNKINKEDKELKKLDKENKTRLMTEQEVSDWLCQCPEECREFKYKSCSTVLKAHSYYENKANSPADDILIRRNHGKWEEPLIEI